MKTRARNGHKFKSGFLEYVLHDAMQEIAGVTARAMFGAHGLYRDGMIFGIVDDDKLYLKAGKRNLPDYKALGSRPLTYEGKGRKVIALPYWEIPLDVLEDRERLSEWVNGSIEASRAAKNKRRGKSRIIREP